MEAIIEINFRGYSENIVEVLRVFQKIGWSIYNSQEKIEYLPIADNDNYDWQCEKMSEADFWNIINQKVANGEQIGINLFYNKAIGISFLAHNTSQIVLGLCINRKSVYKRHTDMAWYFENIIYKLFKTGVRISSYKFEEYED